MAKVNLGLTVSDAGVAEERQSWAGELPPTGSYKGFVKVLSLGTIGPEAKNAGKPKLSVGVELRADKGSPAQKYDGFIAWGNLNLIESAKPYINQFLMALTDGSDEQFAAIQKAFENNIETDARKKHIEKIGRWNVNSPNGELPIMVSLSNKPFHNEKTNTTTQQVRVESYLLGGGGTKVATNGSAVNDIPEEEDTFDLEVEDADESILD